MADPMFEISVNMETWVLKFYEYIRNIGQIDQTKMVYGLKFMKML